MDWVIIYLMFALNHMASDARGTFEAGMEYRYVSSFIIAMLWPIFDIFAIIGVIYRKGKL